MNALIVIAILLLGLFALAYFTKRRFGVLGLALCAGSLLSASWAATLTPLIAEQGIVLIAPPLSAVVAAALVLLPPVLLFFSGPTYSKQLGRIGGAAMFAVLALVFLLKPLGVSLLLDETSMRIINTLNDNSNLIIVIGIAIALADILVTRTPKGHKAKPEH